MEAGEHREDVARAPKRRQDDALPGAFAADGVIRFGSAVNLQTEQGQIADEIIKALKNVEVQHAVTEMPPGELMPHRNLIIQFLTPGQEPKSLEISYVDIFNCTPDGDYKELDCKKLRSIIELFMQNNRFCRSAA